MKSNPGLGAFRVRGTPLTLKRHRVLERTSAFSRFQSAQTGLLQEGMARRGLSSPLLLLSMAHCIRRELS